MKTALIIGSSKGIGRAIKKNLQAKCEILNPSSKELDTSNITLVKNYSSNLKPVDIIILNTGGPPAKDFFSVSEDEWLKYFNQLFLGFVVLLKNINIRKNGYIFLISSHTIKNPEDNLIISNSIRSAFASVFKTLSNHYSKKNITTINIAPGPIKTKRLINLVKNLEKFEKNLPLKKAADPNEIGKFIASIIDNNIKYINGTTIVFDGGLSKSIY